MFRSALLTAVLALACARSPRSGTPSLGAHPGTAKKDDGSTAADRVVCYTERPTGSNIAQRVCYTEDYLERTGAAARDGHRRAISLPRVRIKRDE